MTPLQATCPARTVTVITVSFNSAGTIVDTLRSVAEQSHPAIQHIVIDGGSIDGTLNVIERHGRHVARIVSERDNGIYDAMNKGLALASGAFVGFLNADDMFAHRDVVAHIAAAAGTGPIDAVYGDLVYVDRTDPDKVVRYWRSGQFEASKLRFGWMPPHPTLYVRQSRLLELGGFDTQFRIAADYDFVLRCLGLANMRVAYLPQVLVKMRTGGVSNGSTASLLRKSKEDLRALKKNGVGGIATLMLKNFRKLPQLITKP